MSVRGGREEIIQDPREQHNAWVVYNGILFKLLSLYRRYEQDFHRPWNTWKIDHLSENSGKIWKHTRKKF